ncbi:hypothetical protein K8R42_05095 [bacterium]|nr:hypothetical protein [bacterium]
MKRLFTIVALLAITHLAALAALGGYAWQQGWLEPDRVDRAMAVLRGEDVAGEVEEPVVVEEVRSTSAIDRIRQNQEVEDIYRTEFDRRNREIQDGWKLLEAQQLTLLREKEDLEAQRRRWIDVQDERARRAGDDGFQKELDILSGLKAKAAKELLKLKDEADVVRIVMAMEGRKVQKIVDQCKTSEERLWIERILEQLHNRDAAQAEDLGAGNTLGSLPSGTSSVASG